jgi:hypothetical protein
MSSLRARVQEQFQLFLEFICPSALMLKYSNLSMTVEQMIIQVKEFTSKK